MAQEVDALKRMEAMVAVCNYSEWEISQATKVHERGEKGKRRRQRKLPKIGEKNKASKRAVKAHLGALSEVSLLPHSFSYRSNPRPVCPSAKHRHGAKRKDRN